jgi:uncharacterized protein involved in exopolysaccharide biosynthesis
MQNDSIQAPGEAEDEGIHLLDLLVPLVQNLRLLVLGPLAIGVVALGIAFILPKTYTARTSFLPPQQQQNAAGAALAQIGALVGLAGGAAGLKTPADQYVALMQSETVVDRLIERFDLMKVYGADYRIEARDQLASNVRMNVGKKDGLISVEVDDEDPTRAANLANAHVEELRRLSGNLALTEAQQRRVFFEDQLQQTRDRLIKAQQDLQSSGFNQGALKAEPKAAAEGYAQLRAEVTAAEVRLQTLRRSFTDTAPEVQQQQTLLAALRGQLALLERSSDLGGSADYVTKFREFKYQETLFELFARQYELARIDESREGALIQVVDVANTPEYKSKPKRGLIAVGATLLSALLLVAFVLIRDAWQRSASQPESAEKLNRLRLAWRGK